MRPKGINKFSILLNIVLILFIVIYFFVPWSVSGIWAKTFSPLCSIVSVFQGQDYLPGWCVIKGEKGQEGGEGQQGINENANLNSNVNAAIANPASVKCVADGGRSEIVDTESGQVGYCVFSDNSICDEWAYFRGECKKSQCQKVCNAINTKSEGWYNSCTGALIKLELCSAETNSNTNANVNANGNINSNANINASVINSNTNTNITNTVPTTTASSIITVTSPVADQQLTSPMTVSGRAKLPDNKVYVRLKNKAGLTAISIDGSVRNVGADGYGDFSLKINYEFSTTKEGSIDVFGKNGAEEVGLVNIPVKF